MKRKSYIIISLCVAIALLTSCSVNSSEIRQLNKRLKELETMQDEYEKQIANLSYENFILSKNKNNDIETINILRDENNKYKNEINDVYMNIELERNLFRNDINQIFKFISSDLKLPIVFANNQYKNEHEESILEYFEMYEDVIMNLDSTYKGIQGIFYLISLEEIEKPESVISDLNSYYYKVSFYQSYANKIEYENYKSLRDISTSNLVIDYIAEVTLINELWKVTYFDKSK